MVVKANLRILNLEDSANDSELNRAMLSARWPDCQLVRVDTRKDFLAALEAGGFDIILCDYSMPGFDGLSALVLAREKAPEIPFVFVSGTIGEDRAIETLKNGAMDYVLKSQPIRLIPAVDRALQEAEERAECKRAEESMRQSECKYRLLFESLHDAAFLSDAKNGKIIDVNPWAGKLLGLPREQILGRRQSDYLIEIPVSGQGEPSAVSRSGPAAERYKLIRADGSTLPVEVHVTELVLYGHPLILRLCHETAW